MAPLLTRRSTHHGGLGLPGGQGCPAHAGIDPRSTSPACDHSWLPRSRGDRPRSVWRWASVMRASPLTRGSTRHNRAPTLDPHSSPAHAGIDRRGSAPAVGRRRFPCSRRDRPIWSNVIWGFWADPPFTRGSTLHHRPLVDAEHGSPSHAGIDPKLVSTSATSSRLPRSRGDRPSSTSSRKQGSSAPPLTRGSTQQVPQPGHHRVGSLAHAGIDPTARWCGSSWA